MWRRRRSLVDTGTGVHRHDRMRSDYIGIRQRSLAVGIDGNGAAEVGCTVFELHRATRRSGRHRSLDGHGLTCNCTCGTGDRGCSALVRFGHDDVDS